MDTLNQGLNVLQSIQLPFALIPVLYISTREDIMGTTFVVKAAFRRAMQLICSLLLVLNLSLVAIALFSDTFNNIGVGITACIVALAYAAFVLYLLVGPGVVHEVLSKSEHPACQLLNRLFGREQGDCEGSPIDELIGAARKQLLGQDDERSVLQGSYQDASLQSGSLHDGQDDVAEM